MGTLLCLDVAGTEPRSTCLTYVVRGAIPVGMVEPLRTASMINRQTGPKDYHKLFVNFPAISFFNYL